MSSQGIDSNDSALKCIESIPPTSFIFKTNPFAAVHDTGINSVPSTKTVSTTPSINSSIVTFS